MLMHNFTQQLRALDVIVAQYDEKTDQRAILAKCKLQEVQDCIESLNKANSYAVGVDNHEVLPVASDYIEVRLVNDECALYPEMLLAHPLLFKVSLSNIIKPIEPLQDIIRMYNAPIADY